MDEKRDLIICLIEGNPELTGAELEYYATQILRAEMDDDYVLMYAFIQEALWGQRVKPAA
jgi:hypothetical protein